MKYEHIILDKGIHRISAADEYWDVEVAVNWPFVGWTYYEWSPHRCGCGNTRFFVCRSMVEIPPPEDAPPDPEPTYRPEFRIVCPACIIFRRGEIVLGEIEFSNMSVCVYHPPAKAPDRDSEYVRSGFAGYIPRSLQYGEDYFDILWFDSTKYRKVVPADTHVYREYLGPASKEKRKPRVKHVTKCFNGFEETVAGESGSGKRRRDPGDDPGAKRRVSRADRPQRKAE